MTLPTGIPPKIMTAPLICRPPRSINEWSLITQWKSNGQTYRQQCTRAHTTMQYAQMGSKNNPFSVSSHSSLVNKKSNFRQTDKQTKNCPNHSTYLSQIHSGRVVRMNFLFVCLSFCPKFDFLLTKLLWFLPGQYNITYHVST